jgi:hypothetical protein
MVKVISLKEKDVIMNKFKSAPIKVLEEVGIPLRTKGVTRIALENGYPVTDGKTPELCILDSNEELIYHPREFNLES